MNVVALRTAPADGRPLPALDTRFARVEIFGDMAAAMTSWRALESCNNLATPYQGYDFLQFWQRHVGAHSGISPFIAVGFNAHGTPLFLWPLGRRTVGGLRVAGFLGGTHAHFHMAIWTRAGA